MKDYLKKTIEFYNNNFDDYFQKTINLQDTIWLEKFITYLPKSSNILDVGCAFGRDSKYFSQKKFKTYGIDLSQKMIKEATKFSPKTKFFVMDMTDLKFNNNFFNGIWCSASLLHLKKEDSLNAISEFNRVLKKDGYLFINLKEGQGEKIITDERYQQQEKFYSYYSSDEIKGMLQKNGFKVKDFTFIEKPNNGYNQTGLIYLISQKI